MVGEQTCLFISAVLAKNAVNVLCMSMIAANQWLQVDLGPPTLITGVVTKGRGDGRQNQWVMRFRLSYSNDSHVWYFYEDSSHPEVKASCKHLFNSHNKAADICLYNGSVVLAKIASHQRLKTLV